MFLSDHGLGRGGYPRLRLLGRGRGPDADPLDRALGDGPGAPAPKAPSFGAMVARWIEAWDRPLWGYDAGFIGFVFGPAAAIGASVLGARTLRAAKAEGIARLGL